MWNFFESHYWKRNKKDVSLIDGAQSSAIITVGGDDYRTARKDKTVVIMYGEKVERSGQQYIQYFPQYTLHFASENDAKTFTGEDRGRKCEELQSSETKS